MRFRQVHLDFHTSEKITHIGERFDAKQFQAMLKLGHVDSVTVFSKCHHGWAYHPSRANETHPNLNFDLLKAQIDAAHEIGVKTPVYLSAGFDEKAAVRHPEWLRRSQDERLCNTEDFMKAGYHELCLNTPYLDTLLAQIAEVATNYDCDGIFLDIVGVRNCWCRTCVNELQEQGEDPRDHHAVRELGEKIYKNYTDRVRETVHAIKPSLPIFHNSGHVTRGKYDSMYANTHLELESLPTGGWGYDHFPASAHYVGTVKPTLEYLGMTGKFHLSWGEFGGYKHPSALQYETTLNLALGAKCSIGDQLHPDGHMDERAYGLIGQAYAEVKQKEPWCQDTKNIADIAIFSEEANREYFGFTGSEGNDGETGASRVLLEGKYLYDIIDMNCDFSGYKLLVLPDSIVLDEKTAIGINSYIEHGGKVLVSGLSGLDASKKRFLLNCGCDYEGISEYSPTYALDRSISDNASPTVVYGKAHKIRIKHGCQTLANRYNPYFNRDPLHFSSHMHSPYDWQTAEAGVIRFGNVMYCCWEIFSEYARIGSITTKELIITMLENLIGGEKRLETNLGSQGIVTLRRQEKLERDIVHLLYAVPVKRGCVEIIEDVIPVYGTTVVMRTEKPSRVYLAPQNENIPFAYDESRLKFTVDTLIGHQMIALESR